MDLPTLFIGIGAALFGVIIIVLRDPVRNFLVGTHRKTSGAYGEFLGKQSKTALVVVPGIGFIAFGSFMAVMGMIG